MSLTAFSLLFLLGLNLPSLASLAARLPIPNAVGDVLLQVRCPSVALDCHLSGSCYSTFKVCAKLNDMPQRCVSVPELENDYQCRSRMKSVLTVVHISLNASVTRMSVIVMAQKKTIFSKPQLLTDQIQLLPGLKALTDATVPTERSWKPLNFSLLFHFAAVFRCRQHHFGSLCRTVCNSTTCPPPLPTSVPKQCKNSFVCLNGGTCVVDPSGKMHCLCTAIFRGNRCEILARCTPNFCLHGGACRVSNDSWPTCVCRNGWHGTHCDEKSPTSSVRGLCLPNPCENGGACSEDGSKAVCKCSVEWTGTMCESKSACSLKPCKNNGNCSVAGNSFICSCPANTLGVACQLLIPKSLLDNQMFVIVVSVGISLLIIMTLIFGTCLLCRRSKRTEQFPTHIEATLRSNERQRRYSDVYAEIDSENCYSDGSDSGGNLEARDRVQRARTRSTSGLTLYSSRAASVICRNDKTL